MHVCVYVYVFVCACMHVCVYSHATAHLWRSEDLQEVLSFHVISGTELRSSVLQKMPLPTEPACQTSIKKIFKCKLWLTPTHTVLFPTWQAFQQMSLRSAMGILLWWLREQ